MTDEIRDLFISDKKGGELSFDSLEQMDFALKRLFYFRAYAGLDMMIMVKMMGPPDFEMCSDDIRILTS